MLRRCCSCAGRPSRLQGTLARAERLTSKSEIQISDLLAVATTGQSRRSRQDEFVSLPILETNIAAESQRCRTPVRAAFATAGNKSDYGGHALLSRGRE